MANNQNRLKLGTWNFICDVCGFKCKAEDGLLRWDGLRVDRKCWEPRQPQDFLRSVREYSNPPPWTRPDVDGLIFIPVANFYAAPAGGPSPLFVQFTDTSTGSPTSWAWDLDGDGNIDSTDQNPTFTYLVPGLYNVTLTATNSAGSNSITKYTYINAGPELEYYITPEYIASGYFEVH